MMDAQKITVVKDFTWNICIFIIALALVIVGYLLSVSLIDREHVVDSLKTIAAMETIPVFFIIATTFYYCDYNRISAEASVLFWERL
jgi:hypothetical protein